jgi:hypothetical protein
MIAMHYNARSTVINYDCNTFIVLALVAYSEGSLGIFEVELKDSGLTPPLSCVKWIRFHPGPKQTCKNLGAVFTTLHFSLLTNGLSKLEFVPGKPFQPNKM